MGFLHQRSATGWRLALGASALLLQFQGLAQGLQRHERAPDDLRIVVLPSGPLGELCEAAPLPQAAGLPTLQRWPDWSDKGAAGWGAARPWQLWTRLLLAQAEEQEAATSASPDAPARRASLALLARNQDRDQAAWQHLLACADGALLAEVLPAFLPGRPLEGSSSESFDGVFRPALPPANDPRNRDPRAAVGNFIEHRAVQYAGAVFEMRVQLEGDGIQVDLTHVSGPEVSFQVLPPEPPQLRIALLYADWTKVATRREPVAVTLVPGSETFTIWGRFLAREGAAPIPRGGRIPRGDAQHPLPRLLLRVDPQSLGDPCLNALAEALGKLTALAVSLHPDDQLLPREFPEPIEVRLGAADVRDKKVLELIDRLEACLLQGRP